MALTTIDIDRSINSLRVSSKEFAAIENPNEFIDVPSSFIAINNHYFGLKVNGLSMIENGIYDGDIAVIKKTYRWIDRLNSWRFRIRH